MQSLNKVYLLGCYKTRVAHYADMVDVLKWTWDRSLLFRQVSRGHDGNDNRNALTMV